MLDSDRRAGNNRPAAVRDMTGIARPTEDAAVIRFQCPACKKVLKVADDGASRKVNCPRCGQRLLIPAAPAPPGLGQGGGGLGVREVVAAGGGPGAEVAHQGGGGLVHVGHGG
jgi:DNA-directed RNA polymerase subunit RPC12/RpoP